MKLPAVLALLIFSACASTQFKPDLTLMHSPDGVMGKDRIDGLLVTYHSSGKKLTYLAVANHAVPRTMKLVQDQFTSPKYDAVVIEGMTRWAPWRDGPIPAELKAFLRDCEQKQFEDCGEAYYSLDEGIKHGMSVYVGEPSNVEVVEALKKQGYSMEDLLGYSITRMIPGWRYDKVFTLNQIQKLIEDRLVIEKKSYGLSTPFYYDDYIKWFMKHNSKVKSVLELNSDYISPDGAKRMGSDAYIQGLARYFGQLRDESMVNRITYALNLHKNVLVVYGLHWAGAAAVLEKMLGKPEIEYFKAIPSKN